MILFNDLSPSSIAVMAVQCGLPSKVLRRVSTQHGRMPFSDAIIYITSPVVISNGIVGCRISENGEIQLLLVMTGVMASFLATLAVGTASIPFLSSFPVSDGHVMRRLCVICHNIIGLIAAVFKHILWCRI